MNDIDDLQQQIYALEQESREQQKQLDDFMERLEKLEKSE